MFKTIESVLETELSASWTGLDHDQVSFLRKRVVNTLLWGDPEGLRRERFGQQKWQGPAHIRQQILDEVQGSPGPQGPRSVDDKVGSAPQVNEFIAVIGPDEYTVEQWAAANGHRNVYVMTSRNPSAVRGLAVGSKVIVLGRTSPDIDRILSESAIQAERVSI